MSAAFKNFEREILLQKKQAVPMTLLMFNKTERLTYSVCLTQMLHNYNY